MFLKQKKQVKGVTSINEAIRMNFFEFYCSPFVPVLSSVNLPFF